MIQPRVVSSSWDWLALREAHLTSVIDPMLVRVADLFAHGGRAAEPGSWDIVGANLHSLAMFIDALVLEPGIPVFDYRHTIREGDTGSNAPVVVLEYCEGVAQPVSVHKGVWVPINREVALALGKTAAIPPARAQEIGRNLQALRWKYIPVTSPLDMSDTTTGRNASVDALVNSYLFVLLSFSRYAAELGGTQILDHGQSRNLLLAAFPNLASGGLDDASLFAELNNVMNKTPLNVERALLIDRPTFLPFLSRKIEKPHQLFQEAVKQRDEPDVKDYREWIQEARSELRRGELSQVKRGEVARIAESLTRRIDTHVKFSLNLLPVPSASISKEIDISLSLFWLFSFWPGKSYRRLLSRISAAQEELVNVGATLAKAWNAA